MNHESVTTLTSLIKQLQVEQKHIRGVISIQIDMFNIRPDVHCRMKLFSFMCVHSGIEPKEDTSFYKQIIEYDPTNENHKYYIDYEGIRFFAIGTPKEAAQYGLHV